MNIHDYVIEQENAYNTTYVNPIADWQWSMKEHIELSVLYKNSQYSTGDGKEDRPFKNIVRPLLNLQYRAEGFDVKDIELFVDSAKDYYKSFLLRKYHDLWARKNKIDTFIDKMVESYVDFGAALVKKVFGPAPEVVPLQSIAFCDQTALLSGPIAIRHNLSPDELLEMADAGWGNSENGATTSLEDLILLAEAEKQQDKERNATLTPGKYIEVYEVHGNMPESFLGKDSDKYTYQVQIVTFLHKADDKQRKGLTLYAKKSKNPFKLILRDEVYGKALGLGGVEELFDPQVWTNNDVIRMKEMLDEAAKIIYKTTDSGFAARNKTVDMQTGEVVVLKEGSDLAQIDNFPRNLASFTRAVDDWQANAQMIASAQDAVLGETPPAGTPFALQQLVAAEGHSIHDYRKGKLASFLDEVYQDWVIPQLSREVVKEQEFLSELELDELQEIADTVSRNYANKTAIEKILNGESFLEGEVDGLQEKSRKEFMRGGNKRFIKILEGEMKRVPISVKVNIVGKQKDMPAKVESLTNIFRQVIVNPAVLQIPPMAKLFNAIVHLSGLDPIDFSGFTIPQQTVAAKPQLEAPKVAKSPVPVGVS